MSYTRSVTDKVAPIAAGAGLYYLILWIFSFYPAFIIGFTLQRMFFGLEESGGSYVLCLLVMIIGTFVILGLAFCKQYFIVLMLYIVTVWPFLYILNHYASCESGKEFPLPLDWCPFW